MSAQLFSHKFAHAQCHFFAVLVALFPGRVDANSINLPGNEANMQLDVSPVWSGRPALGAGPECNDEKVEKL